MGQTRAQIDLVTVPGEGLRFSASNDAGRSFLLDSGKAAIAPNPMEALLAALGACSGMDVISILRKKRQDVTAYAIEVVGQRREEHPRVYTSIEVVHRLTGNDLSAAAVEEAIRLSDTKYCSVYATLVPTVPITSRFEIGAEKGA